MPEELVEQPVVTQETAPEPEKEINVAPQVSPETQAELDRLAARKAELEKAAKDAEEKAIYWRKQKAEARAEYFRGDRGREPEPPKPAETPINVGPAPDKNNFTDYDEYMKAVAAHQAETIAAKRIAEWKQEEQKRTEDTKAQERKKSLQEKLNAGYQKYADFEESVGDPSVPVTGHVVRVLEEIDDPADVAYYLSKNRLEAIRISNMNSPIQVAMEIKRIQMELKNNPQQQPKITNAPPPIKPVGATETVNKEPEKMTQKEYEAWRASQGARRF